MPRILLLLLCLALQKQPAANKQGAQEQVKKPSIDQPATETRQPNSEAVVKQVRPVESQIPANDHKEQDRAQRIKEINDTLLVIFTGLLFVVGALQAAAIFRQEKWMRRNVKIAEDSVDAAKKSADAAYTSSEFTRETIKKSERAEVLLHLTKITSKPNVFSDGWLELTIRNFGRTRAVDVSGKFEFAGVASLRSTEVSIIHTILGAGQEHVFIFERFVNLFNGAILGRVWNSQEVLRFSGVLTYRDIFDQSYTTRCAGTFDPGSVGFRIDENRAE